MFLGTTSDNLFRTKIGRKFGRRHLFLLIGAITVIIFFPCLFIVVPGSFIWYFIAYVMVNTAQGLIGVAYETLPTEMTPNADDRVKMSSVRLFVSAFATFSISALPAALLSVLGSKTATAYTISGVVFGIVFAVATLITWRSTWEFSPQYVAEFNAQHNNGASQTETAHISLWERTKRSALQYWKVWKNKSARWMVSIYFITYFAKDCYSTAFLYYVVFILGLSQAFGQSVASLSFVGMFVVPVATWMLTKSKNPKLTWGTSFSIICIVLICYGIPYVFHMNIPHSSLVVMLIVLGVLWHIGRQFLEYTAWQVIPLVPDVDTLASTQLRAGTFAAVQTFTRQTTGAIGNAVVGVALSASGFVSGATSQPVSAQNAIMMILVVIPLALILWASWLVKHFNLNQRTHDMIQKEVTRLSNGGSKDDVDPETKKIAEDLTGYSWDQMWNPKN